MQDDLDNQEAVVKALNTSLAEISGSEESAAKQSPLFDKQQEMNALWKSVNSMLRDKRTKLQEKLTSVSKIQRRRKSCLLLKRYRSLLAVVVALLHLELSFQ